MFEDKELSLTFLSNPLNVQTAVLDEFSNRLNNQYAVADPNNTFCFLLEAMSSISSEIVQCADDAVLALNAKRAQTAEDLYKHMSDFDYVNMFASPASITISMMLDTNYLINYAKIFNNAYKKVIIPKDTVFTIGNYKFGLYYPIEIKINRATNSTLVSYDASVDNPLHVLQQNLVEKLDQNLSGLPILNIFFPIYQFEKTTYIEDEIPNIGFVKKYNFDNKFYAVRIYTYLNNEWKEINQTFSQKVYDPNTLTARLFVDTELNILKIDIPLIYVKNNKLGTKIKVEIYTTMGALDVDISSTNVNTNTANFALNNENTTEYSYVLDKIRVCKILPVSTKIIGGNNGYGFNELKERIINNSLYGDGLITPTQLKTFFKDKGFKLEKYIDNITNRIYFCYKEFTDNDGNNIPIINANTKILTTDIDDVSSIILNDDTSITILPTTVYKYNSSDLTATPLTDAEINEINNYTKEEKATFFNSGIYTRSVFHVLLETEERYTRATSFNLLNPKILSITFKEENIDVVAKLVSYTAIVNHTGDGSSGYIIRFFLNKADATNIPNEDIYILFLARTTQGVVIGKHATHIGQYENNEVYELKIDTNYKLNRKNSGTFYVTSLDEIGPKYSAYELNLTTEFDVVCMVKNSYFPSAYNSNAQLIENVPSEILDDYLVLNRQIFKVQFGEILDDVIYNIVDTRRSAKTYMKYNDTEYYTYSEDVYKVDENGNLAYEIVDGKVVLDKIYSKGDVILDDKGNPVIKHSKGDIIFDAYGNAMVSGERVQYYLINMMHINIRSYLSEASVHTEFMNSLPTLFETYFELVKEANAQVLENTKVYFRPINTIGNATFDMGNDVYMDYPLELTISFRFKAYKFVIEDVSLQNTIKKASIKIVNTYLTTKNTSLVDIAEAIKNELSDYIVFVEVLGINGMSDFQTIKILDEEAKPILTQELYVSQNNTLLIENKLEIDFVSVS